MRTSGDWPGLVRGSGLYTVLGRAFLTPLLALPLILRHCSVAQERLWCEHDYPGGACTIPSTSSTTSVLGPPASLIGSELPWLTGSGLYTAVAALFRLSPHRDWRGP